MARTSTGRAGRPNVLQEIMQQLFALNINRFLFVLLFISMMEYVDLSKVEGSALEERERKRNDGSIRLEQNFHW